MKKHFLLGLAIMLASCSQVKTEYTLRVNQVGYYPMAEKVAVAEGDIADEATLIDADGKTVWQGTAARKAQSPWSDKVRSIYDFSSVQTPGEYTFRLGGSEEKVIICPEAYKEAAVAAMKSYYLQRTGMAIEEQYAGVYARPAAHPDTCVMIHPSAATEARPAGTIISSPGGWYDAGDFNKYIVNSGFTMGMLLVGYEMAPAAFDALSLNIPESGNQTPDYLDEAMYNIRWMATMQDPNDGGVYHKLTTPHFEGFVMPVDCHQQRYVVQKATPATLDYAATLAMAHRLYAAQPEYAGEVADYLKKAEYAYAWAKKNPNVLYDQPGYNETCEPQVSTGMYPDEKGCIDDEWFWAATELYLSTGKAEYLADAKRYMPTEFVLPTWGDLAWLAAYEWFAQRLSTECPVAREMADALCPMMLTWLDEYAAQAATSCYQTPFGNKETDFIWGSNGEMCSGSGVALMMGYYLTGNEAYLQAAQETIDYLFGRNATGYCFLTGFGTKQVMHPHQRLSSADGIEAPLPGFLAGGPNRGQQDKEAGNLTYPSIYPDESYLDEEPSYASNEIAINWNAYLVPLLTLANHNLK